MRAAYSGHRELIEYLLEKVAYKEIIDKNANKAIHYVIQYNFEGLKDLLK